MSNIVSRIRTDKGHLTINAPCKLNLGLRIFPPRADGFHPLESWMVPISWHDTLAYTPSGPLKLVVTGRSEGVPTEPEKNLVGRAANKLAAKAGIEPHGEIQLHKVVPPGGGLGGGSSDAANTLVLLNEAWDTRLPVETLEALAAELGSDVALFVRGQPALCTGRGEIMTALPLTHPLFAVLLVPPQGVATGPVYKAFDAGHRVEHATVIPWQQWATLPAKELNQVLLNDLEAPAFHIAPWLGTLREKATAAAGQQVHMTGSGSTLFTLCESEAAASALAGRLEQALAGEARCVPVRVGN